jgi:CRISPR type III-A-associated protein Csm2
MRDERGLRGRGSRHREERPPEKTLDQMWSGYLAGGYFDADRHLKPELVSRRLVEPLVSEMGRARPPLVNHQLRRFFQHCRAIEAKLKAKTSTWQAERAAFGMLDAAAADAFGKSHRKIPQLFHDFIQRNVAAVKTETDFLEGFLPHFEALVGFGAQHLRERERS